jgi:large subunit ribosomal protein L31e
MADEKIFIVPLRKGTQKAPKYKRSKKAINTLREYLVKHMKTEEIRIGKSINLKIWEHGIKNPPHKLKITVATDDKGVVTAELFGIKDEQRTLSKDDKEKASKKEDKKDEKKTETKEESKKIAPKKEEK